MCFMDLLMKNTCSGVIGWKCFVNAKLFLRRWWFQIGHLCWSSEFSHFLGEKQVNSLNAILISSSPFHVFRSCRRKTPILLLVNTHTIVILGDCNFIVFDIITHLRYFSLPRELHFIWIKHLYYFINLFNI